LLSSLGRGSHGKVKLAKGPNGALVALKIIDRESRSGRRLGVTAAEEARRRKEKIRKEIAILKKCAHPHVVGLQEVIDDPASKKVYLVLEYMEGGELIWRSSAYKPAMERSEARRVLRHVTCGLEYLHRQGVIHRDVKPANILRTPAYPPYTYKLSDFGVSHLRSKIKDLRMDEEDKELARTVGSPAFLAPELCSTSEEVRDQPVNHMLDVWALGVTLYCLCYGQCPWWGRGEWQLFHSITHDPLPIPDTEEDTELIHLLQGMLNKNVHHRLSLQQVKSHPWTLRDLEDPEAWLRDTDVETCTMVKVNAAEVHGAVETLKDKVKGKLRRLSTSF
ncbi:MAG: kinase-like domain-containing protein, partial [Piptocephalis tieghemiana]